MAKIANALHDFKVNKLGSLFLDLLVHHVPVALYLWPDCCELRRGGWKSVAKKTIGHINQISNLLRYSVCLFKLV